MYSNHFPDGLTETYLDGVIAEFYDASDIEALIDEALDVIDDTTGEPTSALLDGTAARRRSRRIERRTISGTVRKLPVSGFSCTGPDGEEAA